MYWCNSFTRGEVFMQTNTFDVVPERKRITMFKLGKLWVFKHFFEDKALFLALLGNYNKDQYRFEFGSTGARNNALKILDRAGFDYELVEDLKALCSEAIQVQQICTLA
jgi:hypothetical protein